VEKIRVSVILPKNAVKEIRERMLDEGYSLREKSKWISEAIENFLQLKNFQSLVEIAELVNDFTKTETIYIPDYLEEKIEEAIIKVRKQYPTLEGVKSLIIRASIIRRLIFRQQGSH
jgi:metal-responsive CopG/Arc/MetJ family transcriptional regulator